MKPSMDHIRWIGKGYWRRAVSSSNHNRCKLINTKLEQGGINYSKTLSPVFRYGTFRLLLALTTIRVISTAFLYWNLESWNLHHANTTRTERDNIHYQAASLEKLCVVLNKHPDAVETRKNKQIEWTLTLQIFSFGYPRAVCPFLSLSLLNKLIFRKPIFLHIHYLFPHS